MSVRSLATIEQSYESLLSPTSRKKKEKARRERESEREREERHRRDEEVKRGRGGGKDGRSLGPRLLRGEKALCVRVVKCR